MKAVIFQFIYNSHDANHEYYSDYFEINYAGNVLTKIKLVLKMAISLISNAILSSYNDFV